MLTLLQGGKNMRQLLVNIKKRKEKIYQFYYKGFGQMIKKRRLELDLTQEEASRAICSHTYISKAENNRIILGEDQLMMIMERLDIKSSEFAQPEKLIYYLNQAIKYFYFKDKEKYEHLIDKFEQYNFHALIEVIKLGYYTLIKDCEKASQIYNQLLDYLESLDDFAFDVFLVFSAFLAYYQKQFSLSQFLIETSHIINKTNKLLNTLNLYIQFLVYGELNLSLKTNHFYNQLISDVMDDGNIALLRDLSINKALFSEYQGQTHNFEYIQHLIDSADQDLVDRYLLVKGIKTKEYDKYIDLLKNKESEKYLCLLFFKARQALEDKNIEKYELYQKEISDLHYKTKSSIDYIHLLDMIKKEKSIMVKEYLVNTCLKTAKEREDIFFMTLTTDEIVNNLQSRSRYKDALAYYKKLHKDIKNIRFQ
jgi:transcriptional regulator with XRE-family HTH domain